MKHFTVLLQIILVYFCFASCTNNKNTQSEPQNEPGISVKKIKYNHKNDSLYRVARTDPRSRRVFVVIDSNIITEIKKIILIIKQIETKYKFNNDLNISFVCDFKYAGYKDELEQTKGISFYEFYLNYLGEYNKKSGIYWTFPSLPEKKIKYIMSFKR